MNDDEKLEILRDPKQEATSRLLELAALEALVAEKLGELVLLLRRGVEGLNQESRVRLEVRSSDDHWEILMNRLLLLEVHVYKGSTPQGPPSRRMPAYCTISDTKDRDIATLVLTQDGDNEMTVSWKLGGRERRAVDDAVVMSIVDEAVRRRLQVYGRA